VEIFGVEILFWFSFLGFFIFVFFGGPNRGGKDCFTKTPPTTRQNKVKNNVFNPGGLQGGAGEGGGKT